MFPNFAPSFENNGEGISLTSGRALSITSFQHGALESRADTDVSGCILANLDTGYPCRCDEICVVSVGERRTLEHSVVFCFLLRRRFPTRAFQVSVNLLHDTIIKKLAVVRRCVHVG